MRYIFLIAMLLVGCGGKEDQHLAGVGPVVFPPHAEAPIVVEPAKPAEPEISDAEKEAQDAKDWDDAKAAIAKLSSQDIDDLDMGNEAKHIRAHFAAKKLTDREKDLIGTKD